MASTPEDYVASLPPERAEVIAHVRKLVNDHIPAGYREVATSGMIAWGIPLSVYPDTYNKQPLAYAALAAQKNHYALYLNCVYGSPERSGRLRDAYAAAGKKLDMGKSCLRFKKLGDLLDDAIAREIAAVPPDAYIAEYEATRAR